MTLAEFLRARLADDEQAARAVDDHSDPWPGQWEFDGYGLKTRNGWSLAWPHDNDARFRPGFGEHVARYAPARALAEVAAKRRILAEHRDDDYGDCYGCGMNAMEEMCNTVEDCPTLRALAAVYANHPDYDPAWRP